MQTQKPDPLFLKKLPRCAKQAAFFKSSTQRVAFNLQLPARRYLLEDHPKVERGSWEMNGGRIWGW